VRLRDSPNDLAALVAAVSRETEIPETHIEKDFWLTEALRGMAAHADEEEFPLVFKGGTSLSKAFRLIQRFSEDIDILVVLEGGKGPRNAKLKALVSAAEAATNLHATAVPTGIKDGVKRTARLAYPAQFRTGLGEPDTVLLEIGTRGGVEPWERRPIRSLLAEHTLEDLTPYEEATPFDVSVLSPVRTLIEKLCLLHTAHEDGDEARVIRIVRHYYDVHELLAQPHVLVGLRAIGVEVLAEDVFKRSIEGGFSAAPRPSGGFAASPAFSSGGALLGEARAAFDPMISQLVWPTAARPTFDECLTAVQEAAEQL
jgi:hypothetical protein